MSTTWQGLTLSDDILSRNPEIAAEIAAGQGRPTLAKTARALARSAAAGDEFRSNTERLYAAELSSRGMVWHYNAIAFVLPGGVIYTPDFDYTDPAGVLVIVEIKGSKKQKNARDSRTRFRVAAGLWPAIRWVWAEKVAGEWIEETIDRFHGNKGA